MTGCSPLSRTKVGRAYTDDNGINHPPTLLHMMDCACGHDEHKGLVWYADPLRAMKSYRRRSQLERYADA